MSHAILHQPQKKSIKIQKSSQLKEKIKIKCEVIEWEERQMLWIEVDSKGHLGGFCFGALCGSKEKCLVYGISLNINYTFRMQYERGGTMEKRVKVIEWNYPRTEAGGKVRASKWEKHFHNFFALWKNLISFNDLSGDFFFFLCLLLCTEKKSFARGKAKKWNI